MCGLLSIKTLVCGNIFYLFIVSVPSSLFFIFFNLVLINQMECLMTPACSCLIYIYNMLSFFLLCFNFFFLTRTILKGLYNCMNS